ncbi:MAG TPA: S46 family peptidase [Thermoanaerobaculia bacterium]|nr:S46 family peptidase [Thermoanaerobaculia bacterium]
MNRKTLLVLVVACLALAPGGRALAVEGKWTPEQILELDPKWLREQGLEIPPERLWGRDGAGLLDAAVKIDGCSAGFISADGLLVTNHHCAFGILQQHSTPERDLITGGFLAANRAGELPGNGTRATIPHRTEDVTAQVEAAVPAGADDLARFRAIERKTKELVAACEAQPNRRCQVSAFDGGVRYLLIESLELPDVRLVYAPPRAVGEYGGEVDNWSWPRHTGDFALLRVYTGPGGAPARPAEGNLPYKPRHWFPVAPKGVGPGDFVLVAGYPGLTYRSLTEAEMRERAELWFPRRAELYRTWIGLMEAASEKEEAARIALADRAKTLANREKNARGQVAGIRRGRILERKQESERQVLAWAAGRADQQGAVAAHRELDQLIQAERRTWDRDFLLEQIRQGPKPLDMALTLVRWAGEKAKPDLEREPEYMERNRDRLADNLRNDQKRFHLPTDEAILADLLGRFAALPEGSRVPAVEALLAGARTPEAVRAKAASLLAGTKVTGLAERTEMSGESEEQLRARRDPLLDFAFAFDRELRAWKERDDRHKGAVSRLRPAWQRAVIAHAGKPVAPDANGTLRLSLAHVQGYEPRDAVRMEPQTTVAGLAEKHTGEEPFDAPDALLAAAPSAPRSRWADPKLGDVPVAFLADADTTGGNSGSPVVNGRGELVGVNFDRVWENVANDFGYNPDVARNISVDVRFLLWTLETTHGEAARPLLAEMGAAGPAPR